SATIDNASGVHSRRLTIQQGGVGDTVMSLLAEGPTGNGTYRCVFEARLTSASDSGGLQLGPSSVTSGRPRSACTPGADTQVRLLPGATLQRVNTGSGEQRTYTRDRARPRGSERGEGLGAGVRMPVPGGAAEGSMPVSRQAGFGC